MHWYSRFCFLWKKRSHKLYRTSQINMVLNVLYQDVARQALVLIANKVRTVKPFFFFFKKPCRAQPTCSLCQMQAGLLLCFCAISSLPISVIWYKFSNCSASGKPWWLPTNAKGTLCTLALPSNNGVRHQVLKTFGTLPYPIVMCTWMQTCRLYTNPYGTRTLGIRRPIWQHPSSKLNSL